MKQHSAKWFLFAILCIAFYMRFVGVDFSLPFSYDYVENIIIDRTFSFKLQYEPEGTFVGFPLLSYLLILEYGIVFVMGKLIGAFHTLKDFHIFYFVHPSLFYYIGRVTVGVLFGTGSVYLLYVLAKMCTKNNEQIALLSAFFLSVSFLHVRESHFIHSDIPFTFFILLGLIYIIRLRQNPQWKYFVLIGILTGIATAMKLSGCLLLFPFFLSGLGIYTIQNRKRNMFAIGSMLVGVFFLIVFCSLNPGTIHYVLESLHRLKTEIHSGHIKWLYHSTHSLLPSVGIVLFIGACIGGVCACMRVERFLLLMYALSYYLLITVMQKNTETYIMPIIPLCMFFSAWLIISICKKIFFKFSLLRNIAVGMCSFFLIADSMTKSFYMNYLFLQKDTRTQAYEWVTQHIPSGSSIAMDACSPLPLHQTILLLKEKLSYITNLSTRNVFFELEQKRINFFLESDKHASFVRYQLFFVNAENRSSCFYPLISLSYDVFQKYDIEYFIFSDSMQERIEKEWKDVLAAHGQLEKEISPFYTQKWDPFWFKIFFIYHQDPLFFQRTCLGEKICIYKMKK